MTARVLKQIRQEHRSMDRVLRSLLDSVKALSADTPDPREIELIHSTLYYIRIFPDRLHHPKEEDYLFRAVRKRAPESGELIDGLEQEHERGVTLLDGIYRALIAFERNGNDAYAALARGVSEYVEFERQHMRREEEELLPMAEKCLTRDDWYLIDDAFARSIDPLIQESMSIGFKTLYERIVGKSDR